MAQEQRPVFKMPDSGFGEFQNRFDDYYDEAEDYLLKKNPQWAGEEFNHERNSGACEIACKATIEYIKRLGYQIEYPPKPLPEEWPEE